MCDVQTIDYTLLTKKNIRGCGSLRENFNSIPSFSSFCNSIYHTYTVLMAIQIEHYIHTLWY